MTSPPAVPQESLGVLIGLLRRELVRTMEAELLAEGIDLRFTQYLILKRLLTMGAMSASELARVVELDGGAMTRQLDQLENRGYLRRRRHEQDRRALHIELTEAGKALSQQSMTCTDRVVRMAQRALAADERKQLHHYLERMLQTLRDKS
ncbi:MAG: MarR family transcriptional regulator [Rhodanobacter sp.]|jgi:DNA-binding MarR family transcriptional regulator|nr:MarR family transcriptional regulator [Rhodanobacter sp.]